MRKMSAPRFLEPQLAGLYAEKREEKKDEVEGQILFRVVQVWRVMGASSTASAASPGLGSCLQLPRGRRREKGRLLPFSLLKGCSWPSTAGGGTGTNAFLPCLSVSAAGVQVGAARSGV